MRQSHTFLFLLILFLLTQCGQTGDQARVKIAGTMRSVMHGGDLKPILSLDTLKNKEHLFGVGPLAFLKGEITIYDGVSYLSTVESDTSVRMSTSFNASAPFFVYANVDSWREVPVPEYVFSDSSLEQYLAQVTATRTEPFTFKVSGLVEKALIHVVNLPDGAKVGNSSDAHVGQQDYILINKEVDVVGFYSASHKGIFTHHDSNVHMHLITGDKKMMGHVDALTFRMGSLRLWISSKG